MHEIVVCPGTPSDVVRLAPVVHALRRRDLPVTVVSAARDRAILGSTPGILGLSVDVDPAAGGPARDPEAALAAAFDRVRPSAVVVAGDAIAAVRAANAAGRRIRLAHLSGARRTADPARAFGAEAARRRIAGLATWHFVTAEAPRRRLVRAGVDAAAITVTGATAADAARWTAAREGLLDRPPRAGARRVLVVARAARSDRPRGVVRAVARLAERADVEIALATTISPAERAALAAHENVRVRGRLAWDGLVAEIAAGHLVLTDDGLVEEAAPALGVPVLAMREPAARADGGGVLPCGTDPVLVLQHAERLLDDERLHGRMASAAARAADGRAGERIAARLAAARAAAPADALAA
jgi:UDP-N-acetylglucosamine 2-epimerase (non-hydrolysing)